MSKKVDVLVVGATGILGSRVVARLTQRGLKVRALVRSSSDEQKRAALRELGAELVEGDLKQSASLARSCADVRTVISTATSTVSRQQGDSIQSVDELGQLALIDAAEKAGVEHFVLVSFPSNQLNFQLQRAKRKVEERLVSSRMTYTILHPTNFTEVWLSPMLGFDPARGFIRIIGSGERAVSWISVEDVARFTAAAAQGGAFLGKTVPLGGPEALSPLQLVALCRELGLEVQTEHVGEEALRASLANPKDELDETFAALLLNTASGQVIDPHYAVDLLPGPLASVRAYLAQTFASSPAP